MCVKPHSVVPCAYSKVQGCNLAPDVTLQCGEVSEQTLEIVRIRLKSYDAAEGRASPRQEPPDGIAPMGATVHKNFMGGQRKDARREILILW